MLSDEVLSLIGFIDYSGLVQFQRPPTNDVYSDFKNDLARIGTLSPNSRVYYINRKGKSVGLFF